MSTRTVRTSGPHGRGERLTGSVSGPGCLLNVAGFTRVNPAGFASHGECSQAPRRPTAPLRAALTSITPRWSGRPIPTRHGLTCRARMRADLGPPRVPQAHELACRGERGDSAATTGQAAPSGGPERRRMNATGTWSVSHTPLSARENVRPVWYIARACTART